MYIQTGDTINGSTSTYCYDMADRLIASSDARFTNPQYDNHGNTTSLGDTTHKTEFSYDALDRNTGIAETATSSTRETIYQRDVTDRILRRTYKVDSVTKDDSFYGFISSSDSPSFLTDANGVVTQKYLSLAGGVKVTIKPQSTSAGATTYSLANMHGDTMATVDADGTPTIVAPTGPFGERTPDDTTPNNTAEGTSNDYLGVHRKATEKDYLIQPIQMGARVYIPELGRFLQVDSVEGGTLNNYVYAMDPVNQSDLSGEMIPAVLLIRILVPVVIKALSKQAPKQATKAVLKQEGKQVVKSVAKAAPRAASKPSATPTPKQVQQMSQSVGSRNAPLMDRSLQDALRNRPATIGNVDYTGHAQNAMQNSGIYPSMVQSTIKTGSVSFGKEGAMIYDDVYNGLRVIVNPSGSIKTTYWIGGGL